MTAPHAGDRPTSASGDPGRCRRARTGPVSVSVTDMDGALACLDDFVRGGGAHYVCFAEANLISHAVGDPRLVRILERADLNLADGITASVLARLGGTRLPGRVSGPALLPAACAYGLDRGWRHFFYGAAPGVADRLADRLRQAHPGIAIAGTYSPPFRPLTSAEEVEVKRTIEAAGADLLWIALGGPKQEHWMAGHVGKIDVPVMLGVGAAFDFHSGARPWAPPWMRHLGLEWLFRMFTGGSSTFSRNCRCVTVCARLLLRELLRATRRTPYVSS